jgi:outer membrane protein assembly factor BamB
MQVRSHSVAVSVLLAALALPLRAGPLVGWRNDGTGVFPGSTPPAEWSAIDGPAKNIAWHTTVGASYSSPIVAGDRVFLMVEPDKLVCVARDDGQILWSKTSNFSDLPPELHAHEKKLQSNCGYTTPTPVSDGKNVFIVMGTGIVASYDLDGERNWITWLDVDPGDSFGRSASPRLVDGLLIAPVSVLFGLDAATGKIVWKSPDANAGFGASGVMDVGGTSVLITPTGSVVRVKDGKVEARVIGSVPYASPLVHGDTVYFVSGHSSAVRLSPKEPDAVEAREIWNTDLDGEFFASPLLSDGWIHAINKDGVYNVLDARTGKVALTGSLRLPPGGDPGDSTRTFVYPSVSLAGRRLFVGNTKGEWELLDPAAGDNLKSAEVRINRLPDGSPASPAFAGGQMFLRSGAELYCVAASPPDDRR